MYPVLTPTLHVKIIRANRSAMYLPTLFFCLRARLKGSWKRESEAESFSGSATARNIPPWKKTAYMTLPQPAIHFKSIFYGKVWLRTADTVA